jgi:hypothetical protein
MEINLSKWVGELFIYLCIPEFTYWQHMWMTILMLLQWWLVYDSSQVITKARLHTQLVCGPWALVTAKV